MTDMDKSLLSTTLYFLLRAPCKPEQNSARLACIDWYETKLAELEREPTEKLKLVASDGN
jgi:hypothetical protein